METSFPVYGSLETYKGMAFTSSEMEDIRRLVRGYTSNNILYRIKNAFLAIFRQSDWQKARNIVANKIIQKAGNPYKKLPFYNKIMVYFQIQSNADRVLKTEITPACLANHCFFSPFSYNQWINLQSSSG